MKKLFTIGYGGRSPNASDFLSILKENNIAAVVDVRLRPNRAYSGAYVKAKSENKGIQLKLKTVGIKYYSFKELGNHFMESEDWSGKYKEALRALERAEPVLDGDARFHFNLGIIQERLNNNLNAMKE